MLASSRPIARQCALFARSHPSQLFRKGMASSTGKATQEWVAILPDQEGVLEKRMQVRPDHLKDIQSKVSSGFFVLGGGILSEPVQEGQPPKITGSIIMGVSNTKEEFIEALKNDVYTRNNVWDWDKVQIFPFKSAIRTGL